MKVKTPFFVLEIEWLFLIIFFIYIFSNKIKTILSSFFMCYMFIVFHELSHIFIASIFGKEIEKFKFTLSGVCIELKKEKYVLIKNNKSKVENIKNILIYIVGPLSNILLALVFKESKMLFEINMFLALVNLLPIYPLDGYNIIINILELIKLNKIIQEIFFIFITYMLYFILLILGIIQFFISKNISIIIFLLYTYLLKKIYTKNDKICAKYTKNTY